MFDLIPFDRRENSIFSYLDNIEKSLFGGSDFKELSQFRADIADKGDHYLLEAELPGFKKEDIKVDMNENTMTISAERHSDYEEKDKKGSFLRCERSYGAYSRSFDISGIDTGKVEAEYKDGVLKLVLPKKQPEVPASRRLEIR